MTVYLVRHAIAEPRGADWPDDTQRPLTARGIARMRDIALRLAERGVEVDRLWTSPLVRARQTADLLAPVWTRARTIDVVAELAPDHTPAQTARALAQQPVNGAVAIVGHEPGLGDLAAWLLGAAHPVPFKKGGVAKLNLPAGLARGSATLAWLITPKLALDD